ncbi:hypothetical protein [Thermobrachium celere]|uniref:hypothetical protein n=1 Tax=Thermobrachium celere TaxID=53422 RepID=UPI001940934A|nr:hypothetical protein [Thermobrachium celere]GFR35997.1 hypothetical protein TCEA9_18090 [Thermobrachium celere]
MLILILISVCLYKVINKISDTKIRKIVTKKLLISIMFQLFLLIIYRLELKYLGRVVYYSDAEDYWRHTLEYLSGNYYSAYNEVYIWICYFIQKSSPFVWVGWNNIYNILITNLSIIMCSYIISIEKGEVKQFLNFTLFNPLVIYALMRNLKDATYLFFVCLIIYVYYLVKQIQSKFAWMFYFIFCIIMSIFLYGIRPWAFLTSIVAIYFIIEKIKIRSITKLLLIGFFIFFIRIIITLNVNFKRMYDSVNLWLPIVLKSAQSLTLLEKILAIPRLFLGPGPFRSILGHEYFLFYTLTGNIMAFLGSIFWWIELAIILSVIITYGNIDVNKTSVFSRYMFYNLILFCIIYSMAYGGSSELRFRGVLYIMVSSWFFSVYKIKNINQIIVHVNIFLLIITIGSLIFG